MVHLSPHVSRYADKWQLFISPPLRLSGHLSFPLPRFKFFWYKLNIGDYLVSFALSSDTVFSLEGKMIFRLLELESFSTLKTRDNVFELDLLFCEKPAPN